MWIEQHQLTGRLELDKPDLLAVRFAVLRRWWPASERARSWTGESDWELTNRATVQSAPQTMSPREIRKGLLVHVGGLEPEQIVIETDGEPDGEPKRVTCTLVDVEGWQATVAQDWPREHLPLCLAWES